MERDCLLMICIISRHNVNSYLLKHHLCLSKPSRRTCIVSFTWIELQKRGKKPDLKEAFIFLSTPGSLLSGLNG